MEKKSEKRADPQNVKKQLEAVAGKELDLSPEQIISLRHPVGAIDSSDGTVLWKSIIIVNQSCNPSALLDASGATFTGSNGSVTFLLSNFVCLPLVRSLAEPVNVQATVRSTSPFFLTMTHTLVTDPTNPSNKNDVQITVNTWDATGNPAANVSFDWRCRLVSNQIFL
jgi:hypothetical protein